MRRRRLMAYAAAAVPMVLARTARGQSSEEESLPHIEDLQALLDEVRTTRRPLLLFFTTPGCPYCREVRRNYLAPRVADGAAAAGATIREVDITSRRSFAWRPGERVTEYELARRFDVRMVPVIQPVDATLALLWEPLVGLDRSGFFEARLQEAIEAATRQLTSR
jgi:thioredoxin-related protein